MNWTGGWDLGRCSQIPLSYCNFEMLQEEWRRIPVNVLQKLVGSMPDRVAVLQQQEVALWGSKRAEIIEQKFWTSANYFLIDSVQNYQFNCSRRILVKTPHHYLLYNPNIVQNHVKCSCPNPRILLSWNVLFLLFVSLDYEILIRD